jgi:hypothetical protein
MLNFWKKRIILRLQAMFFREITSTSKRYSYMELKRLKLIIYLKGGACMDLKAGKVFCKDTFEARKYPMLEEDLPCDVCIEGRVSCTLCLFFDRDWSNFFPDR